MTPFFKTSFQIEFNPNKIGNCQSTAYLEICGRDTPIPLKLYGYGKGPSLELNVKQLDISNIYFGSEHQYEIVVHNTGNLKIEIHISHVHEFYVREYKQFENNILIS